MTTTQTDIYAWIGALKPGDTVVVQPAGLGYSNQPRLARVARLTPTQIVIEGEGAVRFRRSDGRGTTDFWSGRACLLEATPERRKAIRRTRIITQLSNHDWSSDTDDVLNAVAALIDPP